MPCRGVFSGLPGTVTLLWALYNCIGPYLLLHYTYLGRQDSLRVASSLSMHLALGLAVLAVALLVMFSPTSHDLAQVCLFYVVRRLACLLSRVCIAVLPHQRRSRPGKLWQCYVQGSIPVA